MPSTVAAKRSARGLRDSWYGRLGLLVLVLAAAFLASRSCASRGDVDKGEAIRIAVQAVDFDPECALTRFRRRGLKAQATWYVHLWTLDEKGEFERISIVAVDAESGRVVDVIERASGAGTRPLCRVPV